MDSFAPRRATDPQIATAIKLGWRIAMLYSLHVDELPSSPPDGLLPTRRSLPSDLRLVLELRTAAGAAGRVGAGLKPGQLEELLSLVAQIRGRGEAEESFRDSIRRWHIELETVLWAEDDALGKAYDLGCFLADTSNRPQRRYADAAFAVDVVAEELRRVFAPFRLDQMNGLLDDLQARIDPAAVTIVQQHLRQWYLAAQDGALRSTGGLELSPLDRQTTIWCQLVTGDKQPEAFIGDEDQGRLRDTMVARLARSYSRGPKAVAVVALAVGILVLSQDLSGSNPIIALLGSLAGALGLSLGAIWLSVRKSLDNQAGKLWNTALVDVITQKALLVDQMFAPAPSLGRRLRLPPIRRRR